MGQRRIAAIILLLLLASALSGCLKDVEDVPQIHDGGEFAIMNLGVTFGSWNHSTNRSGDFIFSKGPSKVFLEFGAVVNSSEGGTKELPTFEYLLDPEAEVFAIAEGTVTRLVYQEDTGDYEFSVRSNDDSKFTVEYDHVTNITVAEGDVVQPGDILGNPGTWSSSLGRFEIMISNSGSFHCPFKFFDDGLLEQYQAHISQLMEDWETYRDDSSIYDETEHVFPGCRMYEMEQY
jgi:hypothetical protein